ncbi:MAG: PDZ domain-containing protein [Thermoanaerobaculia bacterium]
MSRSRIALILGILLAGALPAAAQHPAAPAPPAPPAAPEKSIRIEVAPRAVIVKDGKVWTSDSEGRLAPDASFLVKRGWLGLQLLDITPQLRKHFGAPEDAGVLVGEVEEGSPAARAGIQVGDLITSIEGEKVRSSWNVRKNVRSKKSGDRVTVGFLRNGAARRATVTISEHQLSEVDVAPFVFKGEMNGRPLVIGEGLAPAMKRLETVVQGPEWNAKIESLGDCGDLQTRLSDLEKRLKALEKSLKK